MPRLAVALLIAGLALGANPRLAVAQEQPAVAAEPGADDARFSFHRVQDSFVRLDGRTGQVSVCGREAAGWACRAVPDERVALEEAIGRLQSDNAALKKELLAKGLPLPGNVKPEAFAGNDKGRAPEKPNETAKLPSDAEIDRVLGFVERIWRRLVEMMVDFQREIQRKS